MNIQEPELDVSMILNFELSRYLNIKPRDYQIELFIASTCMNTMIYTPKGAGKSVVAATCSSYFKQLNPSKHVYFVCNNISNIFKHIFFLKNNTNLKVTALIDIECHLLNNLINYDVVVFSSQYFETALDRNILFIDQCCCLIINLADTNDDLNTFNRFILKHYASLDRSKQPPLNCLLDTQLDNDTISETISKDVKELCRTMNGRIYKPIIYEESFKKVVYRHTLEFYEVNEINNEEKEFSDLIERFINYLLKKLNAKFDFKLQPEYEDICRAFLIVKLREAQEDRDEKQFIILSILNKFLNSIEMVKVLGISSVVSYFNKIIELEVEKELLNNDLNEINKLKQDIQKYNGNSSTFKQLCKMLKTHSPEVGRLIILVANSKTAVYLYNYLKNDNLDKYRWNPCVVYGRFEFNQRILSSNYSQLRESKLIITTRTVGLDQFNIQTTDKIIIFDSLNLIYDNSEFISCKLVSIETFEKYNLYNNMKKNELIINELIEPVELIDDFNNLVKKMVQKVLNFTVCISNSANSNEKITLQVYICASSAASNLSRKTAEQQLSEILNKIQSFMGLNACNHVHLSHEVDVKSYYVYDCYFAQNVNSFFEILNKILSLNACFSLNCAVLSADKLKKSILPNDFIQLMCIDIEFGNLVSPFLFVYDKKAQLEINRFKSGENIKLVVKFDLKVVTLLLLVDMKLFKFEIDFAGIESITCLDDDNEYCYAYIPCKRPLFMYCASDSQRIHNIESINDEKIRWNRTYFSCKLDWTLKLKLNLNEKIFLANILQSISSNQCVFTKIKTSLLDYNMDELRLYFKQNISHSIAHYNFECLISQFDSTLNGRLKKSLIDSIKLLPIVKIDLFLEKLISKLKSCRFASIDGIMQEIMNKIVRLSVNKHLIAKNEVVEFKLGNEKPQNAFLVKYAVITPTRIIYYLPELSVGNRILRQFGCENFLRVRIRDEDIRKLINLPSMDTVYARVKDLISNGIKLCDRSYNFLAMSTSQLHEHGCWLYSTPSSNPLQDADFIRNWMGDFKNIRCIGKYAARLGQSLSSSLEVCEVNEFKETKEIEKRQYGANGGAPKTHKFSDGIGKICPILANRIRECMRPEDDKRPISAFQIRYRGYKGVVSVDPELMGTELELRKSMKKFDSNYNKLDLLAFSKYIPCYLNRQIIVILSALGISDDIFMQLQDSMIKRVTQILVNNVIATQYVIQYYKINFNSHISYSALNYTYDPFYKDLLKAIYSKQLNGLINKARVFIEKGRILMGVIDERRVLKEKEVFIQCSAGQSHKNDDNVIVEGKVAVAKNPCMHPGDIRVLNAVNKPELSHIVDCIVFPAKGKRPVSDMCSGSDLDGDLYFVTWESTLIPVQCEPPMEYDAPKERLEPNEIQISQIIDFLFEFIRKDSVGRISNAHLALSDVMPSGCKDEICKELAKEFSLAVDFPKTGKEPQMPEAAKRIPKYPDFMEKHPSETYESQKVLGIMYRKCKEIALNTRLSDIKIKIDLNPSLVLPGHEKYLTDAVELYEKYRYEIECLLSRFDMTLECELFIGSITDNMKEKSNEKKTDFGLSLNMLQKIWSNMRTQFFAQFKSRIYEMQLKASAWYVACYSHNSNDETRILSFPWIVEDVLMQIETFKNYDHFGESMRKKYFESIDINSDYYERIMRFKSQLESILNYKLYICNSYGLFLFEDNDHVEFIIYDENEIQDFIGKGNLDSNLVNRSSLISKLRERLTGLEWFKNINVTTNSLMLECDHFIIEISESKLALLRYAYLNATIKANMYLLPMFYVILHYLRLDNLHKILEKEGVSLDFMLAYIIGYLKSQKNLAHYIEPMEFLKNIRLENFDTDYNNCLRNRIDEMNEKQAQELGNKLLIFYHDHAYNNHIYEFNCIFKTKKLILNQELDDLLRQHFFNAFNTLSQFNDIYPLWDFVMNSHHYEPKEKQYFRRFGKRINSDNEHKTIMGANYKFLFSNYESKTDFVEFYLLNDPSKPHHFEKRCYSIVLQNKESFHNMKCQQSFFNYFCGQLAMLSENAKILFCIQFGSIYYCNINAKRTKVVQFMKDFKLRPSFDTTIDKKIGLKLHNLLKNAEFQSFKSEEYILNVDMIDKSTNLSISHCIKYDKNLKFIEIVESPNELMCIDVSSQAEYKDIRLSILSSKPKDTNGSISALNMKENLDSLLLDKIKEGVIRRVQTGEHLIVNDFFRKTRLVAKRCKNFKYRGTYDNWRLIFQMTNINENSLPKTVVNSKLFSKITINIDEIVESSENDLNGFFKRISAEQTKISINLICDISEIEHKELAHVIWNISRGLSEILTKDDLY